MKKNMKKMILLTGIAATSVALSTNNASAYTHTDERFYVNSNYNEEYRHIDDVYYFGEKHETISIGRLNSGSIYNISIGDISLNNVQAVSLDGVTGGVIPDIDISDLKEATYSLIITNVATNSTSIYSVVIDKTAPEFDKDTELALEGRTERLEYDGAGAVEYEFKKQSSGDIYGYNVYWENSNGNLVPIETLEAYEYDSRFNPGTEGLGDYDRYEIVVRPFDRAFNEDDKISETIDYDSDDKNNDYDEYEDITNITVTASFTLEGLSLSQTVKNGETLYIPAGVTPSYSVDFDYSSKGGVTQTLGTESVTSSSYSNTITLNSGSHTVDSANVQVTIKQGAVANEAFQVTQKQWNGSKVITNVVDATTITNSAELETLSPVSGVKYFKEASGSLRETDTVSFLEYLRSQTSTISSIVTYDSNFNKTTYSQVTVSTSSSSGNVSFNVSDVYDSDPTSKLVTTIELTNLTVDRNDLLYLEVFVNGTSVDLLDERDVPTNGKYSFNYSTNNTDIDELEVQLTAYYTTSGGINVVSSSSAKKLADVEQELAAYAYVNYMIASENQIKASVSLFDTDDKLHRSRMVLLDEDHNAIEKVDIEPGTTVYTFNNLKTGEDYTLQVQGESRGIDYEDRESVLNGDYTTSSRTVPYTDDIEVTALSSNDLIEIKNVNFDLDRDELEIDFSYTVKEDTRIKELDVDVRAWVEDGYIDLNRGSYPNNNGDDLYEEEISIDDEKGNHSDRFIVEGIDDKLFYKVTISDGATKLLNVNIYPEYSRPSGEIELDYTYGDTAVFDVTLDENDTDLKVAWIYVFEEGDDYTDSIVKVQARDGKPATLPGLDDNEEYVAELRVDYTAEDRTFISNELLDTVRFTINNNSPKVNLSNVVANDDKIYFDYTLVDSKDTFVSAFAKLYLNDKLVSGQSISLKEGNDIEAVFTDVTANENYEIRVTMEYVNLNTGKTVVDNEYVNADGSKVTVDVFSSKIIPSVTVSNLLEWSDQITLDAVINDKYGAYQRGSIKVFEIGKSTPIVNKSLFRQSINSVILSGLKPDTDYEIRIDAYYETSTGSDSTLVTLYKENVTTLDTVDAVYRDLVATTSSIDVNIFVVNEDKEDAYAELLTQDGEIVEVISLREGNNKLEFDKLKEHEDYTLRTYYTTVGKEHLLNEVVIRTSTTSHESAPSLEAIVDKVSGNKVTINLSVDDKDKIVEGSKVLFTITDANNRDSFIKRDYDITNEEGIFQVQLDLPFIQNEIEAYVEYEIDGELTSTGTTLYVNAAQRFDNTTELLLFAVAGILGVTLVVVSVVLFRKKDK